MKIATFNVNSIRTRLPIVLEWLRTERADVLCVQETKVEDALFPAAEFEAAGYRAAFRGQKAYNGVAILSRQPADETACGLDDGGPADESRLMRARFGSLHVVNTYVPQGRELDHPMYAYKLAWFRRLREYFARTFTPRRHVVWVGDMNVAPEPSDVHNPADQAGHVCFHEDVRRAYAETVGWGFVDVFRKHHPEPGHYSFFDYRVPGSVRRGQGWRVDHILATRPLAARCTDCAIDLAPRLRERPSDHTVVVATFDR